MKYHSAKLMTKEESVLDAHKALQSIFVALLGRTGSEEKAKQAIWDALRCVTRYGAWPVDEEDGLMDFHLNGMGSLIHEAIRNHS